MSNIIEFATARKTVRGELVASWLDGGEIRIYDGDRPETADTAITDQTLLVAFTIPNPSGTVTNGVFTGGNIGSEMIAETGTAFWARIVDESEVTICDGDVGIPASGALIVIDSVSLVKGGYCNILSFILTEG